MRSMLSLPRVFLSMSSALSPADSLKSLAVGSELDADKEEEERRAPTRRIRKREGCWRGCRRHGVSEAEIAGARCETR
eukprot:729824-Rhodomonas_salina.1